jgi:hypothetical protein
MRSVYERDAPDFILLVVDAKAENWVVRTALIDIAWLESQTLECLIHPLVELAHAQLP